MLKEFFLRFFSTKKFVCFEKNLKFISNKIQNKNENLILRVIKQSDIKKILNLNCHNKEFKEKLFRTMMLKAHIGSCLVAVDKNDIPLHLCWLITSKENKRIESFFNGGVPWLRDDEIIIEGAYTPAFHRKKGIMSSALFKILEKGSELGAQRAIVYVRVSNLPSLKIFIKAGFKPFSMRVDKWRFFQRNIKYIPMENNNTCMRKFNQLCENSIIS